MVHRGELLIITLSIEKEKPDHIFSPENHPKKEKKALEN